MYLNIRRHLRVKGYFEVESAPRRAARHRRALNLHSDRLKYHWANIFRFRSAGGSVCMYVNLRRHQHMRVCKYSAVPAHACMQIFGGVSSFAYTRAQARGATPELGRVAATASGREQALHTDNHVYVGLVCVWPTATTAALGECVEIGYQGRARVKRRAPWGRRRARARKGPRIYMRPCEHALILLFVWTTCCGLCDCVVLRGVG